MKVITWNINCEGDYFTRLPCIIKLIKDENPDIIALQEVKYGSYGTIIDEFSKYNYVLDRRVQYNRMYGELLLVKDTIINSQYISLKDSPNIRGITIYETSNYTIATTHLEDISKYNDGNTKEVINIMNKYSNFILLGDFNYYKDSKLPYKEVKSNSTYVSEKYISQPDRIFIKGFDSTDGKVICTKLSDHYPLTSNIFLVN